MRLASIALHLSQGGGRFFVSRALRLAREDLYEARETPR